MILKRTGTNKSVPSEDLPDLPCFIVKKLKKQIESIAKDTYKSKKIFNIQRFAILYMPDS